MTPRKRVAAYACIVREGEPPTAATMAETNPKAARLRRWARRRETALRWTVWSAIAVLLTFLAFMGTSGSGTAANAGPAPSLFGMCPFGSQSAPPAQPYHSGVDAMIPGTNPVTGALFSTTPSQAYGNTPVTAYEQYGMSGLTWSRYTDDCWTASGSITSEISNELLSGTKALAAVEIALFNWASSPDLMRTFLKPLDCLMLGCDSTGGKGTGLKDRLFLGYLEPVWVLGSLYMMWVGLFKKRTTETLQAAMWMFGSTVVALIFMSYPSAIANGANNLVASLDDSVISIVAGAMSGNSADDICHLPANAPNAGQRMASCSLYESIAFTPWQVGQFGSGGAIKGGPDVRLGDRTLNNMALAQIDAQAVSHDQALTGNDQTSAKKDEWQSVQQAAQHTGYYTTWKGDQAGDRIGVAVLSLFAAGSSGFLFVIVSFATVVMAIGMVILILTAPLFLLVGVHPGFGRGIALKWLELLLGTVVKRIILGFVLALLVGFDQIVQAMDAPWLAKLAMIEAVGLAFLLYRKPLMKAFNIVSLKGATATGLEDGGQRFAQAGKKAVNVSVGAAAGGAGAAAGGGSFLAGAKAGGTRGLRSGGGTIRTASSGASAGRRVAAQSQGANPPPATQEETDSDDPFAYDKARRAAEREREQLQRMVSEYRDDPEMQRRLQQWSQRTGKNLPPPRPARAVPEPDPAVADTLNDLRQQQADTDRKVDDIRRDTQGGNGNIPRPK